MAALIREPPRTDGAARKVSLRAQTDELDVSAIARKSGGGGHRQAAGLLERPVGRGDHATSSTASSGREPRPDGAHAVPQRLARRRRPRGQAGGAVVVRDRRGVRGRTGARTGHAGTLDPFATGLLLLFLGAATKLAQRFVGLDKRYVTDVDLTAGRRQATRRGSCSSATRRRRTSSSGCSRASAARSSCRCPAASAVKIGGGRAYALARRGVAVEMPVRRSTVHSLDAASRYDGRVAGSTCASSSGTYVRSIAAALGGHCATLRRTEVGPFRVEEADEERIVPADEALAAAVTSRARRTSSSAGRGRSRSAPSTASTAATGG